MQAYLELVRQGAAAFRQAPTIMPAYNSRSSASTFAARTLLKPINCSPSLHTAVPLFMYNAAIEYFPEMAPELRRHVGDVVSTVIRAKFHALIDVAFGLYLVRRVLADKPGTDFKDLEEFFVLEQKTRDRIPYEHVYRMYRDICGMEKKTLPNTTPLPELMEAYFQEAGLPRVRRRESDCFYDLAAKTLAYPEELKVGGGLL